MNSLNFINKEIKAIQRSYSAFDLDYMLFGRESDKKEYERLLKKLKHLQQVKVELEAWEVVKNKIYYDSSKEYIDLSLIYLGCPNDKNYQKLKKALKVEENG